MQIEDCFQLGHISRLHGFKGSVVAVFDTDRPEAYQNLESVLIDWDQELIPFFMEEMSRNSKGHFILKFEDINSEAEAQKLIGYELWLPLSALPKLAGKNFYYHEVIGYGMLSDGKVIGSCKSIIDNSAQALFQIEANEKEILVPAIDEFIDAIDRDKKEIHLNLPEGLLELYLGDEA